MKMKWAILLVMVVIIGYIWWSLPIHFLDNVNANDVLSIEVFNGNSGENFTIENINDISHIVSNIQSLTMKREKISVGYMGTLYSLTFYDFNGKIIDQFIVNGYSTIRKDPFFYKNTTSKLCVDYLNDLEELSK